MSKLASIIARIQRTNDRYGRSFWLELLLFPVTSLYWNSRALLRTIQNSKVLLNGQWDRYLNYRSAHAINMLFYWTQAEHFRRWGRFGVSPYLGPGNFHLARWFHLTTPSSYLYRTFGVVLTITAMVFWWLSQMVWLETIPITFWILVTLPALLSTTFIAQTFVVQNYNALGWMFMPFALWGMMSGHPITAALAWFAASFGSITAIFVGSFISLAWALETRSLIPLIVIAPAVLKVVWQVLYCQMNVNRNAICDIAKAIGVTKSGVRYIRSKARLVSLWNAYLVMPHVIFLIACFLLGASGVLCYFTVFILLVLSEMNIIRFADSQSLQITTLSLSTAIVVQAQNPLFILPYWLLINPVPLALGVTVASDHPLRMPILRPFEIGKVIDVVDKFFNSVRPGQRVLFAFNDPAGSYESIFDGYRVILESATFIAARRNWHLLPDWYFVFHHNNMDSPNCWGVKPNEVAANVKKWKANFVLTYSNVNEHVLSQEDDPYKSVGLEPTGAVLDWNILFNHTDDTPWYNLSSPVWKLYKTKDNLCNGNDL